MADSFEVILQDGGADLALAVNFGLLTSADRGASWQFTCEEMFGGRIPSRVQLGRSGRLYVPSNDGLYLAGDACGFVTAKGSLAGRTVWDVALDPGGAAARGVWALTADPRAVHRSTDGGDTFTLSREFPKELRLNRIAIAPSDPSTVYLVGYSGLVPLVMARTQDGGKSWDLDTSGGGFTDPTQTMEFLGVAPQKPETLFVALTNPNTGDEIWRSTNAGRGWERVLALAGSEGKWGFAFGDGGTLFVAGRELFEASGQPTAHLYVSHDGGDNWDAPVASDESGPRYRCLGFTAGRLYACAGDRDNKDQFLLGASDDEGKSWKPVVRVADVTGAKPCAAEICAATSSWLCDALQICSAGPRPEARPVEPRSRDGSAGDASAFNGGGCGCRTGDSNPGPVPTMILLVVAAVSLCVRRALRGRP